MKKTTGVILTLLIIALIIIGGASLLQSPSQNNQDQASNTPASNTIQNPPNANQENINTSNGVQTYTWSNKGVRFTYPPNYHVLESGNNKLALSTATEFPDGDIIIFWTSMEITPSTTQEERLTQYRKELSFTETTEVIGGRTFTKVSLFSDFGGYTYTRYLLETNSGLLDYKVGKGEEALALQVLGSLTF